MATLQKLEICVLLPISVPFSGCTIPLPGCCMISRLLALHLARVLPKIMDLGQNILFQMSGQREMRQRHDFPRSGHSFLFILGKFPFFFFFSVKQLHHMVDSHEVHSQIKLPDVFQKLKIFKLPQILEAPTPGMEQELGWHHTREQQWKRWFAFLHCRISHCCCSQHLECHHKGMFPLKIS